MISTLLFKKQSSINFVTECEGQRQNGQRQTRVPRGLVIDSFVWVLDLSETERISESRKNSEASIRFSHPSSRVEGFANPSG